MFFLDADAPSCFQLECVKPYGREAGKKINHPCSVVWQLVLLLLESAGGRLCPVEQVMTCGGKKKTKKHKQQQQPSEKLCSLFEHQQFMVTCGHGAIFWEWRIYVLLMPCWRNDQSKYQIYRMHFSTERHNTVHTYRRVCCGGIKLDIG